MRNGRPPRDRESRDRRFRIEEIRPIAALTQALKQLAPEQLASMPADDLLTFELLGSPQEASASLSDDEMLVHYPDLIQL